MVIIPVSGEFDGKFYTPCSEQSGVATVGTDPTMTEDDYKEAELLNKETPEKEVFMFVLHGFFEEKDYSHELN